MRSALRWNRELHVRDERLDRPSLQALLKHPRFPWRLRRASGVTRFPLMDDAFEAVERHFNRVMTATTQIISGNGKKW